MDEIPTIRVDSNPGQRRQLTAAHKVVLLMIALLQFLICVVLAFGEFGFDHPGPFGLDFGHLIALLCLQSFLCLVWAVVCIQQRKWNLLAGSFVVAAATVIAASLGT